MAKRPKFGELIAGSREFPPAVVLGWLRAGVEPAVLRAIAIVERIDWRAAHGRDRPRCGAHARTTGKPCTAPTVPGRMRCKLHGGKSTGPRTPEGRKRVAEASRSRMLAYWSRRRSSGGARL